MGAWKNKEDEIAYHKAYREKHRDKQIAYLREYSRKNRDKLLAQSKASYQKRKEIVKIAGVAYREKNKEKISASKKKWRKDHPEEAKLRDAKSRERHAEKIKLRASVYRKSNKEKIALYLAERFKNDVQFRVTVTLRNRIRTALRLQWGKKSKKTKELLGCSVEDLMRYLEAKFLPGMTWDNHCHKGWHIDHIIPCAAFDLTDPEQQKKCFHYTNLQPLWAKENQKKSSKFNGHRISSLRRVKLTPERNCSHFLGDGNAL